MSARAAWLTVLGGTLIAALGAFGVAVSDGPHLTFESLDPWLVVYAVGLCAAFGAMPFGLHARFAARTEDRERRWELALPAWGAVALLAGFAFLLLGLVAGFDSESSPGALAIVGLGVSALVVAGLAVLLLSS